MMVDSHLRQLRKLLLVHRPHRRPHKPLRLDRQDDGRRTARELGVNRHSGTHVQEKELDWGNWGLGEYLGRARTVKGIAAGELRGKKGSSRGSADGRLRRLRLLQLSVSWLSQENA